LLWSRQSACEFIRPAGVYKLTVSLSTVFDVETQENRSRHVMFRDTFSSSDVRRKIFISTETKGMADRPTELRALNMVGSEKWHEILGCSTADPR
jgi:hypothetical protein